MTWGITSECDGFIFSKAPISSLEERIIYSVNGAADKWISPSKRIELGPLFYRNPGGIAHAYKPRTLEVEAGGLQA